MATVFTLRPQMQRDNVVLYHDIVCPWCYVGMFQAYRLEKEFDFQVTWVGAELFPPDMDGPPSMPGPRLGNSKESGKPNRFNDFAQVEGVLVPDTRPGFVRSHRALLACEWAKSISHSAFLDVNTAIYTEYWQKFADIESLAVLESIISGVGLNPDEMRKAIQAEQSADQILPFDDPAYGAGIRNVPTFVFGANEVLAEANYTDLARAMERFLHRKQRLRAGTL